ncbi:hypothetical protein [Amycolatopsis sp. cmx-11-12]|uniref:hypothetical protein n=1 Tax=Amycolatopsis sp. cmx-11-12 TaxID=2785795 RepID=UPI00391811B2
MNNSPLSTHALPRRALSASWHAMCRRRTRTVFASSATKPSDEVVFGADWPVSHPYCTI